MATRIKDLEQFLTHKNVQPTAMRLLVFNYLQEQNSAISLNTLEIGLDHSDRITLYRTLKTFEKNGLIHAIEDGTGATKYALCQEECDTDHHHDLHVHFYCNACNETFCLPKVKVPEVNLPEGYKPSERELIIKGQCNNCA
jgi:Fur family ferric uptake transcriptional regulator